MPTWRCPHCGAPQPESDRCWVCKRSTTCCSACRHFRRAVAGNLGYCGLDRRRAALGGDEQRLCWTPIPNENNRPPNSAPWASRVIDPSAGGRRSRVDFVLVEDARGAQIPGVTADGGGAGFRYQLWDELEG